MAKKRVAPVPARIRISKTRTFEVVHIESFTDSTQVGECRWTPPQIVVKKGQTASEELSTTIHEIIHAIDDDEKIKLTEAQVLKLEKGLARLFRLNPEFLLLLHDFYKK